MVVRGGPSFPVRLIKNEKRCIIRFALIGGIKCTSASRSRTTERWKGAPRFGRARS